MHQKHIFDSSVANLANSVATISGENVLGSHSSVESDTSDGSNGETSTQYQEEERDVEMEDELTEEL